MFYIIFSIIIKTVKTSPWLFKTFLLLNYSCDNILPCVCILKGNIYPTSFKYVEKYRYWLWLIQRLPLRMNNKPTMEVVTMITMLQFQCFTSNFKPYRGLKIGRTNTVTEHYYTQSLDKKGGTKKKVISQTPKIMDPSIVKSSI